MAMQLHQVMSGRGLWCGVSVRSTFNERDWDTLCQQARRWGLSVIHPKVGDGLHPWYTGAELEMLRRVAVDVYHLACVPYWYCYGNANGSNVNGEAYYLSLVGQQFGAISPDMESEWDNQGYWAIEFGNALRNVHHSTALILPTVFANPASHPTPIMQMNPWADAFLPQVYFAEWTGLGQSAVKALDYIFPQWTSLDKELKGGLKPLLPIISLENGLAQLEVHDWLVETQNYGYCGFWHDGTYAQYANTILASPQPRWRNDTLSSRVTVGTGNGSTRPTPPSTPVTPVQEEPEDNEEMINQNLSDEQLQTIWYSTDHGIPYNPKSGICGTWCLLVNKHPLAGIGAPRFGEKRGQIVVKDARGNEVIVAYTYVQCEGDWEIRWFANGGNTCFFRIAEQKETPASGVPVPTA